jgi:hypothetical protein
VAELQAQSVADMAFFMRVETTLWISDRDAETFKAVGAAIVLVKNKV